MATEPADSTSKRVSEGKPDSPKAAVSDADARMNVKVYSPYKVYFEGEAISVSAASATGNFDILPKHHNFITLLMPCDLVVRTPGNEETINIAGGIMHVKADEVTVFLDV